MTAAITETAAITDTNKDRFWRKWACISRRLGETRGERNGTCGLARQSSAARPWVRSPVMAPRLNPTAGGRAGQPLTARALHVPPPWGRTWRPGRPLPARRLSDAPRGGEPLALH